MNSKLYLGLDLGIKTLGLASSRGMIASPLTTLHFQPYDFSTCLQLLLHELQSKPYTTIVIGYPIHMSGQIGARAQMVDQFVELLNNNPYIQTHKMTIHKIDERLTTKMARSILQQGNINTKRQKFYKDTLAAQIILESFLATQE